MTQATELRELATLLDISSGNVGIGLPSGTASNKLVISDGVRTSAAITAGTTALEIARTGGGDVGILINKDIAKWLIGIDNSDGNAAPLRFMYGAYNAAAHPGFGADYSGLNLTYDGKVGIGTKVPNYELHVKGAGDIKIEDSAGGSAHLRIGASTSSLRNSEWKVKVSGSQDAFYIDHDYTANNGSADVAVGASVFKLTSDDNVEMLNKASASNYIAKAIAKDISDTAVDVFVYDTRKDSDGGAWRKRTQHTSWYNETLNTSTRGARKEFPSVAVIVVESNQLTIYDGDDPDMPMWMVLDNADGRMLGGTPTAAVLRDGALWVSLSGYGVSEISFVKDEAWRHRNNVGSAYYGKFNGGIVDRNVVSTFSKSDYIGALVNGLCNDIAVTVLPNAPIDADTGLPIPTIAVATDGGVSVIKDDGTVHSLTGGAIETISINDRQEFITTPTNSSDTMLIKTLNTTDANLNWNTGLRGYSWNTATGLYPFLSFRQANTVATPEGFNFSRNAGSGDGVTLMSEDFTNARKTLQAVITKDFNTGWMNGDIKLATLSDTDTTNVTGSELVTNGTFATNLTGWTEVEIGSGTASFSVSSGKAVINLGGSFDSGLSQSFTTVVGKTYSVSYDLAFTTNFNYSNRLDWGVGTSLNSTNIAAQITTSAGTPSLTFIATGTTAYINIRSGSGANTTGVYTLDNISVRIAESDRSVNAKGLQTFGTVTKTAVATGAELVAYSGFSASNYLQQPYNAGLNFGTGDWSTCFWTKNGAAGSEYIWDRSGSGGDYRIALYMTSTAGGTMAMYTRDTAATEVTGIIGTPNVWAQVWCIRRGASHEIWVNGVNKVAAAATVRNVTTTSATDSYLNIGVRYSADNPNLGSIALLRISATVPTEEQIKKMYNDEKHLFATNAKATLYGTSDAVTALAYDDDTESLHVGTSAGRSVFQGLNRVDNTTDAVGAAISASNGLVAED